jgi:hypothetical protein
MVIAGGNSTVHVEGLPTDFPFTITEISSYPVLALKVKVSFLGQSTVKLPDGDIEPPTEAEAFTGQVTAAVTGVGKTGSSSRDRIIDKKNCLMVHLPIPFPRRGKSDVIFENKLNILPLILNVNP